jgi:uncharacterized protein YjdB
MIITVPDTTLDPVFPAYEGKPEGAWRKLLPSVYATTDPTQTLVVTDTNSFLVPADSITVPPVTDEAKAATARSLYAVMFPDATPDHWGPKAIAWLERQAGHLLDGIVAADLEATTGNSDQ